MKLLNIILVSVGFLTLYIIALAVIGVSFGDDWMIAIPGVLAGMKIADWSIWIVEAKQ